MKIIIAISGNPTLKNRFHAHLDSLKDEAGNWVWHCWNANAKNAFRLKAQELLRLIGMENLKETENFEKAVSDDIRTFNKYFGFEENYYRYKIQNLLTHQKAKVLIMHGVGRDLLAKLKKDFPQIKTVFFAANGEEDKSALYDYTLYEGDNFEKECVELLEKLESEKSENKENK